MKQIITQHGWGLDQSFWEIYKVKFQKNKWYWQDNERGYFSKNAYQAKWIKNNYKYKIKMILCHSLGLRLIDKNLLIDASHIVLINSFYNFLPTNNKRNLVLRTLKRMEKKIITLKNNDMLKEFIDRSFLPNGVNIDFQNIFDKNLKNLDKNLLLEDLKQLYTDRIFPDGFNKNCNVIFIQSENDLILNKDSSNNFIKFLDNMLTKKPIVIKLSNQGHCLTNFSLYETINNILNN